MFQLRNHKFGASKTDIDGITFGSNLEANCYKVVKESGIPFNMQTRHMLHDKIRLFGILHRDIMYVSDFDLLWNKVIYVIDAKGMETDVYKIKRKLMAMQKGINVINVKSKSAMSLTCYMIKEGKTAEEIIQFFENGKKQRKAVKRAKSKTTS